MTGKTLVLNAEISVEACGFKVQSQLPGQNVSAGSYIR